jgi:hypothetical protein
MTMGCPVTFTTLLIWILGGCAVGWYYICVIYLGFIHPHPAPDVNDGFRLFVETSVSTLSGTLATYVGMILGVQTAKSEPRANPVAAILQSRTSPLSRLQGLAAIAYVASLVMAVISWWMHPKPDPAIEALAKSLLGLFGGALAVVLNVNVHVPPSPKESEGGTQ